MASAADGLVAVKTGALVNETLDRFEANAKQKVLAVFVRADHAAGATKVGKTLRPTEVRIFGNPQGGTRARKTEISRPWKYVSQNLEQLTYSK